MYANLLSIGFAVILSARALPHPQDLVGSALLPKRQNAQSCAINAPASSNSYMGAKQLYEGSYNPAHCADACQQKTAYNQAHPAADGTYRSCTFYNAYTLLKNGVPQSTTCAFYTQPWGPEYATNCGQTRGTDIYTITDSYGFTIASN